MEFSNGKILKTGKYIKSINGDDMKLHIKKMIAPIIITLIFVAYFVVYFLILFNLLEGILKYILGIVPLAFAIVLIAMCIERIKEIRSGEEDDISKY